MKRLIDPVPSGGAPFNNEDLNLLFQKEIYDSIQATMSPFLNDVEGIVVSGCNITGVGPFDISAGIVYLNGEFWRFDAVTGTTLPKFIVPSTELITRVFNDGGTKNYIENKKAILDTVAPVSGQYVSYNNVLGALDRRLDQIFINKQLAVVLNQTLEVIGGIRTTGVGPYYSFNTVEIGNWDMDSTESVTVLHGIVDYKKIRMVSAVIRDDADTNYYHVPSTLTLANSADVVFGISGTNAIDTDSIRLSRKATGFFDSTDFNTTVFNRGWITIISEV